MSSNSEGNKHDAGKLRFDLIPAQPLFELARVYTIGAAKYDDRNWENGLKWGRVFRALLSHAWKWWRGERWDLEDGQHHMASVAWCALALIEFEETHPEFDDRPTFEKREPLVFELSEIDDDELMEECGLRGWGIRNL